MGTKEFEFNGFKISGFVSLFLILVFILAGIFIISNAVDSPRANLIIGLTIAISFLLVLLLAVGLVKLALDNLKAEGVVDLDEERKAAMVSNLLVVLCSEDNAQPVINAGTLYN